MGFINKYVIVFILLSCVSCAGGRKTVIPVSYEDGYARGLRENVNEQMDKLNGNDFPYLGGTWARPLVQRVRIPAHVQGGVFYPEHEEMVIITPGEWLKAGGWPIRSGNKTVEKQENGGTVDLTVLPGAYVQKGKK